jgi:hypothetical protein
LSHVFSANDVMFREAKFLISMDFFQTDIVHVPRSCNRGAHDLALVRLSLFTESVKPFNNVFSFINKSANNTFNHDFLVK